ncbi:MAG: class I SAM-dependent methyltransferase [Proteobacteria bacterium]|nr:class I SAM-dependent methyltransferase [Pseudomonadota bacterium]
MSNISSQGISYKLTETEFKLLPYLDSRLFLETAMARFNGWVSPFDRNYLDWPRRIEIQEKMCQSLRLALSQNLSSLKKKNSLKVIYLGAALGSITSYFTLNVLKNFDLLEKTEVYLYDLLVEPLMLTKQGFFEFTEEAAQDCKISNTFSPLEYKNTLKNATLISGNIINLPEDLKDFDIVIAPYIHHHLNIYDKRKACQEMQRITAPGGIILIGDLTFNYQGFKDWLLYHKVEDLPYALECFIPIEDHIGFFKKPKIIDQFKGDIFYNFSLII